MNPVVVVFLILNALALLVLPRRWAPLPLIMGACYVTRAQSIELQVFTFTVMQVLIVVGVARVLIRGEWRAPEANGLDFLMLVWGTWLALSVLFHNDVSQQMVKRLGLVFDAWGLYFLFRVFCQSRQEIARLCGVVAVLLAPIAAAMLVEKVTAYNMFSAFGGIPVTPRMRGGELRAQGPFNVSILAGNIGAVTLPLMIGLWRLRRSLSAVGIAACIAMVYACASSGPIVSAVAGIAALMAWRFRFHMRAVRWAAVALYLALDLAMQAPAYYLIARVDLTGSSTGWHRARLIESSLRHLSEWWIVGTDYTRHWMPTGITWSSDHTDITNHYLNMGVFGGLPLMLLFVAVLAKAFGLVGRGLRAASAKDAVTAGDTGHQFLLWACGASLFAHAATCISVTYVDQSIIFLYLSLALAGSMLAAGAVSRQAQSVAALAEVRSVKPRWPRRAAAPGLRPVAVRRAHALRMLHIGMRQRRPYPKT
jgi:hypothetical protein